MNTFIVASHLKVNLFAQKSQSKDPFDLFLGSVSTFNISLIKQFGERIMNYQQYEQKMIVQSNNLTTTQAIPYYFNPYCPMFSFYYNQHLCSPEKVEQKSKKFQQIGVQTEQSLFLAQKQLPNTLSDEDEPQQDLKQFPFPNKQKLFQVFLCKSNKRRSIHQKIEQLCSPKTKLLNSFYKSIGEKITTFKKTKEEIIKFLIRRAWKKQGSKAGQARERYYSEYKSMNSAYLANIFKENSFRMAYEEMLKNFDAEFDSYNSQRFNRFYDYLLHCYVNNNLNVFKTSKECKSKLPYPQFWKQHIGQIANNLYENYYQNHSQQQRCTNLKQKISNKFRIKNSRRYRNKPSSQ